MPCSAAATVSMDALRFAVDAINFNLGRRSRISRRKGGAFAHNAHHIEGPQALDHRIGVGQMVVEHHHAGGVRVTGDQSASVRATPW